MMEALLNSLINSANIRLGYLSVFPFINRSPLTTTGGPALQIQSHLMGHLVK